MLAFARKHVAVTLVGQAFPWQLFLFFSQRGQNCLCGWQFLDGLARLNCRDPKAPIGRGCCERETTLSYARSDGSAWSMAVATPWSPRACGKCDMYSLISLLNGGVAAVFLWFCNQCFLHRRQLSSFICIVNKVPFLKWCESTVNFIGAAKQSIVAFVEMRVRMYLYSVPSHYCQPRCVLTLNLGWFNVKEMHAILVNLEKLIQLTQEGGQA